MQPLLNVVAEWRLLWPRLSRTSLAPVLAVVALACWWSGHHAATGTDAAACAVRAGMLGAVLSVASLLGPNVERDAIGLVLTHPATPRSMAWGRWLAATTGAGLAVLVAVVVQGVAARAVGGAGPLAAGWIAGAVAAAVTLPPVLAWGPWGGAVWFLYFAFVAGHLPEQFVDSADPGAAGLALATGMELLPGGWRYAALAHGEIGGAVHAAAWIGIGTITTGWLIARRGTVRR